MNLKLAVLILLAVVEIHHVYGWWSSNKASENRNRNYNHDIKTKSGLKNLFNQPVVKIERVERPMNLGPIDRLVKHQGVKVTTKDGGQYLVHKGYGYNKKSNTVVTNAKHMSGKWETVQSKPVGGNVKVGDLVKAGGKDYDTFTDNCYGAAGKMEDTAKQG